MTGPDYPCYCEPKNQHFCWRHGCVPLHCKKKEEVEGGS